VTPLFDALDTMPADTVLAAIGGLLVALALLGRRAP